MKEITFKRCKNPMCQDIMWSDKIYYNNAFCSDECKSDVVIYNDKHNKVLDKKKALKVCSKDEVLGLEFPGKNLKVTLVL